MRAFRILELTQELIEEFHSSNGIANDIKLTPYGMAVAGVVDGKIIGIGGVQHYWDGVGEMWGNYSELAKTIYLREMLAITKLIIAGCEQSGKGYVPYRRLQAVIDCDYEAGIRFAEHLGFVYEGRLASYCPNGRDGLMYARLRGGKQ